MYREYIAWVRSCCRSCFTRLALSGYDQCINPVASGDIWFYTGRLPKYPLMQSYWFGDIDRWGLLAVYRGYQRFCQPCTHAFHKDGNIHPLCLGACRSMRCLPRTGQITFPTSGCLYCRGRAFRQGTIRSARMPNSFRWSGRSMRWIPLSICFQKDRLTGTMVRHPAFSRKYHRTPAHVLVKTIREKSRGALGRVAGEIEQLGRHPDSFSQKRSRPGQTM